jgi:hypothetical protein
MLLGLGGQESRVMPYLVHRLICFRRGLAAPPDCITRPFWVPFRNDCCSLFRGWNPAYEPRHATASSRSVEMISRNYNPNPVSDFRSRY